MVLKLPKGIYNVKKYLGFDVVNCIFQTETFHFLLPDKVYPGHQTGQRVFFVLKIMFCDVSLAQIEKKSGRGNSNKAGCCWGEI